MITDSIIQLSNGIVGNFTYPIDNTSDSAVLMIHGFASSRNEVGNIYRDIAHHLASIGISSLRFDFRGWGESKGEESDITLYGMLSDANIALDFLIYNNTIKKSKIGILAFSIGAGIAVKLIKSTYFPVMPVVLLSSVGDVFEDQSISLKQDFTRNIESPHENELFNYTLPHKTGCMKSSYIRSLKQFNVYEDIKSLNIPIMLIAGGRDRSAERSKIIFENSPCKNKDILIIPESDHIFRIFESNLSDSHIVLNKSVSFFSKYLLSN